MLNLMKKAMVVMAMVFGVYMATGVNTTEALPMWDTANMDETSAVLLSDDGYTKEFAVNVYSIMNPENIETVMFQYTADENIGLDISNGTILFSHDGGNNWFRTTTDIANPYGKLFRATWYYALGYSFT